MKKILKSALLILMAMLMLFPSTAFADDLNAPEWEDVSINDEHIQEILNNELTPAENLGENPDATGLIMAYYAGISRDSQNLYIVCKTTCSPDVVKCGFKEVKVQRRVNGTSTWSTYKTYTDIYVNGAGYTLTKSIAISKGYQYRVTCKHYAKKNALSTQTISNTSNTVTYS